MKKILQKELIRICEKETGLSIIEVPTGRGKTYNVLVWIVQYMKHCRERNIQPRKIFFLTTQLKNLPYDDLRKQYKDDKNFKNEVMQIHKNVEFFLRDDFNEIEKTINDSIKEWDEYENLIFSIDKLQKIQKSNQRFQIYQKSDIEAAEEQVSEAESSFRYTLTKFLEIESSKLDITIPNAVEDEDLYKKKYLIDTKFNWVRKLYPAVDTEKFSVFLLSITKFLFGNSPIVSHSYRFINNDITENAIIFIDEFDATKNNIETILIENAAKATYDKMVLFSKLYKGLSRETSSTIKQALGQKDIPRGFNLLKEKARDLFEKYKISSCFLLAEEYKDLTQNFMFHDEVLHTLKDSQKANILGIPNENTERIDIKFYTNSDKKKMPENTYISISSLLEQIEQYFRNFRSYLKRWAQKYAKLTGIPEEDAAYTILKVFTLNEQDSENLMENKVYYTPYKKAEKQNMTLADIIPDTTYYNHGFDIHHFEDSTRHHEETDIYTSQKHDTAEKFIKILSQKANVIGISATALVRTYDNYNLDYLQDILKPNFEILSETAVSEIRQKEIEILREYEKNGVTPEIKVLKANDAYEKMNGENHIATKILQEYMHPDIAKKLGHFLEDECGDNEYSLIRYLDVIKAMNDFWNDENSYAWLFLTWPILKDEKSDYKESVIRTAFSKIIKSSDIKIKENEENYIVILKSSDTFEDEKKELMSDLAEGKKRMVFSSYQTLMAGQNLNYPYDASKIKDYVTIGNNEERKDTTDFDGIILGDITHQNFNKKKDEENKTTYEKNVERISLCSKIEDAFEQDYIERSEQEMLLKYVFDNRKYSETSYYGVLNKVNSIPLVQNKHLQIIMQSIGRISRTMVKNKEIKIYITNKNLSRINKAELEKHILTPELRELANYCTYLHQENNEIIERLTRRAEKNCTRANRLINSLMIKEESNWDQDNADIWERTRKEALISPTSENEQVYSYTYFEGQVPLNKYYFVQRNDFGRVLIDFVNSKDEFKQNRNLSSFFEDSPITIQEVSEADCRLQEILKCPGMKEYFETQKFATEWKKARFIMTPVFYQNIYKGALGEEAGKFIFEEHFGIKLNRITEMDKFELFDFEISPGVYVDFKHWRPYYYADRQKMIAKITKKLDDCSGKRVYIVNILADGLLESETINDKRIVVIPNLLNENTGLINWNAYQSINPNDYTKIGD